LPATCRFGKTDLVSCKAGLVPEMAHFIGRALPT
jgi:hypothetical protein